MNNDINDEAPSQEKPFLDDEMILGGSKPSSHFIAVDLEVDHRGTTLYIRGQTVAGTEKPPIILLHELGYNSTHYRSAMKILVDLGYSCYCFDMRGHGRSAKALGHFGRFLTTLNDLLQVAAWVRHRENGTPPVIVAHGLLATVATEFQIRHPKFCDSVVLVSPTLKLKNSFSKAALLFISALADLFPGSKLPYAFTPRFCAHIPPLEKSQTTSSAHMNVVTRISCRSGKELFFALETAAAKFMRIRGNTLLIMPESDAIAESGLVVELLERHRRRELITLTKIPGSTHNMITENETTSNQALQAIDAWIQERIQKPHNEEPGPSNV